MKKIIALVMSLIMVCALGGTALAAEKPDTDLTVTIPGITVTVTTDKLSEDVYAWNNLNALGIGKYVYYPADLLTSDETYPVVVWSNGSWCPVQTYYGYIQPLVEAGYVVIADTDLYTKYGSSVVDSVEFAYEINEDEDSLFYGKIDTDAIGATGHSLGGEACVNACASTDKIKCIVSLAGCSTADEVDAMQTDVPTLFFGGQYDINVPKDKYCVTSFNEINGPAVYVYCTNVEHFACWYLPDLYTGYAVDWLDIYLKGDTSKLSIFQDGGQLSQDDNYAGYMCKNL